MHVYGEVMDCLCMESMLLDHGKVRWNMHVYGDRVKPEKGVLDYTFVWRVF